MMQRAQRILGALLLLFALSGANAQTRTGSATVVKLSIHDTVQPITAAYLKRGLNEAARLHAEVVLVSLGTPGGLLDSTREMVQSIESSAIPVIIFISPSGSRAGSAGFFLLEAADVAAMAPGTNAGAAHPIVQGKEMDPILKQKIENDTAAFLRSYVQRRGRNVEAAEDAIRNSKSYSDQEALQLRLIDRVAPDDSALLAQLNGQEIVRFNGQHVRLILDQPSLIQFLPSSRERLLSRLTSPDLDVVLLVLGGLLVYLEFNVPGTIVPGAVGTLFILLALFGLNLLPIRHTSLLLLFAALALIALELKFASHGVLAVLGTACLVLGLATLVDGPVPELRVHTAIAVGSGVGFGVISFCLAWIALKARRSKLMMGPQAMVGAIAVCRTRLGPDGQVEIRGELWTARLVGPDSLTIGSKVRIRAVDELTLLVEPLASEGVSDVVHHAAAPE